MTHGAVPALNLIIGFNFGADWTMQSVVKKISCFMANQ